jgi:hypothetical protein
MTSIVDTVAETVPVKEAECVIEALGFTQSVIEPGSPIVEPTLLHQVVELVSEHPEQTETSAETPVVETQTSQTSGPTEATIEAVIEKIAETYISEQSEKELIDEAEKVIDQVVTAVAQEQQPANEKEEGEITDTSTSSSSEPSDKSPIDTDDDLLAAQHPVKMVEQQHHMEMIA